MIEVNRRGIYTAIVTEDGCADTLNIAVTTDATLPDLNLRISDTVNCLNPALEIFSGVNPANTPVTWIHPDTMLTGFSIITDKPGRYLAIAELTPGCIDSSVINVVFDNQLIIEGQDITCANTEVDLSAESNLSGQLTYTWTLPDNSEVDGQMYTTQIPGDYIMTVQSDNGCISMDTFSVLPDNSPPTLRGIRGLATLNCNNQETSLTFISNARSPECSWTGPNGFISNECFPIVMEPGEYTLTIIDSVSQCSNTMTGTVNQNISVPTLTMSVDTLTCNQSKVTISVESDQRLRTSSWTGPNGFTSILPEPTVEDPGVYVIEATNNRGCFSIDSIEVFFVDDRPTLMAEGASLPCNGDSVELAGSTSTEGAILQWFGPNNFFSTENNPRTLDTGIYILTVIGLNGCFRSDTVEVDDDPPFPNATMNAGLLTCAEEIVQIEATSDQEGSIFQWTGPNSFSSLDQSPFVMDSGRYDLRLEGPNGCVTDTFVIVEQQREDPLVIGRSLDSIICDQNRVRLDASVSASGPQVSYSWSTTNGNIISGANTVMAIVEGVGTYTLTVLDGFTGCDASVDVEVVTKESDLSLINFSPIDPNCEGGIDGQFIVNNITGGRPPFTYSFNGSNYSAADSVVNNLPAGNYSFSIRDSFGCQLDTVFSLLDPDPFTIDLGSDTTLILGDSILIAANFSIPVIEISQLQWDPIICDSCISTFFRPMNSLRVFLTAISNKGCVTTEDIFVSVEEDKEIFVPNIFSPNGDQINDRVTVFATERVQGVQSLSIFNRWGELVFQGRNFEVGDLDAGWDGTLNGTPLNPGVFVYIAEVILFDGSIKILKGDITLIR
ncbi:MAG: gliding motility-associated C-terminal domain-containing protein [Bacteroidota bacterium]